MKNIGILIIAMCLAVSVSQAQVEQGQPGAFQNLNAVEISDALKYELVAGVAFYPDEIIAAILEVSQTPRLVFRNTPNSGDEQFQLAYSFLSANLETLYSLRKHPAATVMLGRLAASDVDGVWALVDKIRADYHAQTGASISDTGAASVETATGTAAASSSTTSVVPIPGAVVVVPPPQGVYVVETNTVTTESGAAAHVETANGAEGTVAAGTVQGENASAAGYGVAVQGENAAHVGGGGVAVAEDGQVATGSAGATVIEGEQGSAVAGHAGSTQVDTQAGTFESTHSAGVAASNGQGAVVQQSAEGTFDQNSFQRRSEGSAQTAGGQGGEWSHQGSGSVTETGASRESSTSIETNSGQTADIERSASLEKTDTGVDVEHGGSVTNSEGQSVEWGNRDAAASSNAQAAQRSAGETVNARAKSSSQAAMGGLSGVGISQAMSYFGSAAQGNANAALKQSPFARKGASPAQTFSARGLNADAMKSALQRGSLQQNKALSSIEPKLAKLNPQGQAMKAQGRPDRPKPSGLQQGGAGQKRGNPAAGRSAGGRGGRGGARGGRR